MKKKALITTTAAVALVAVVGIGSTLAYFTDKADTQNVVTFGHVDISIDEPNFDTEDGEEDNAISNVVPGQVIVKDPTITVDETSETAYLRAKIDIADEKGKLTDDQKAALEAKIHFASHWYKSADGYYYFSRKVEPGSIVNLFDKVTIPETWGNEVADLTFTIDIHAEAIQADSFKPAKDNNGHINGWFYSDGETEVKAETYEAETQLPVVEQGEGQPE
jgi:predicted ribosomally synthesized peptide with SipW-like signal peptide